MLDLAAKDPRSVMLITAIRGGDVSTLERLLDEDQTLVNARIVDEHHFGRTLLHVVTEWPGHWPEGARTVELLARRGADVNARAGDPERHEVREAPLHWAASSDDVAVLEALLDAGADIEVPGAVFTGGTPMSDAVVFAQWNAARRLLERGAKTTIWQAAALGLADQVRTALAAEPRPTARDMTNALWHACRGGQRAVAELLVREGADPNWIGHDQKTALDVAEESGNQELIAWLRGEGAKSAKQL